MNSFSCHRSEGRYLMSDLSKEQIMNLFGFATAVKRIKDTYFASAPGEVQTGKVVHLTIPNTNGDCYIQLDRVADKWPMKGNLAAKGTQDLINLIMHKKVTFRRLLASPVSTHPALLIGSYIVSAQKLVQVLHRSGVRGVTG